MLNISNSRSKKFFWTAEKNSFLKKLFNTKFLVSFS